MSTKQRHSVCNDRIAVLRASLKRQKLDALVITNVHHLRYLFGFSGSIAIAIVSKTKAHFFTNDLYAVQVQKELAPVDGLTIHITRNTWVEAANSGIAKKWTSVGFDAGAISVSTHAAMKKAFTPAKLVATVGIVEPIIQIKAPFEIDLIGAAAQIASEAYVGMLGIVKAGMTEREVANYIAAKTRELGSEKDAFDIIVVAGKRSAMPHGRASDAVLKQGDVVTVDFGACVEGLNSDMTRTFALGQPKKKKIIEVFATLYEAHSSAIEAAVLGATAGSVDAAARNIITDAGYGEYFRHSTGHGLGYEVHESPRVAQGSKEHLPAGAVITIEPGIYLPDEFGMRIEDDVVITEDGPIVLTTAPRELVVV